MVKRQNAKYRHLYKVFLRVDNEVFLWDNYSASARQLLRILFPVSNGFSESNLLQEKQWEGFTVMWKFVQRHLMHVQKIWMGVRL